MLFHLVNANIELELESDLPFPSSLFAHKNFLQLQYLPLLYAKPGEKILVTHLPKNPDPRLILYSDSTPGRLELWGASPRVSEWALEKNLMAPSFSRELLRTLHSKAFSFTGSRKLPGASLVSNEEELRSALEGSSTKVIKTCFGFSGRGHLLVRNYETVLPFCKKEWAKQLPVIVEPWVERTLDFSTQWIIGDEIIYLGETIMDNSPRGGFATIRAGEFFPYPTHLKRHKEEAFILLEKVKALGYKGHVGVDAMIYSGNQLHPILEINPRKTFGYLAWFLHHKHNRAVSLHYGKEGTNCLPSAVQDVNGNQLHFPLRLSLCM